MPDFLWAGLAQFLICWLLARFEIEVEGPHGWAEKLPTWRWGPGWWLKLTNGKPLTGYHVFLLGTLLALLHYPALEGWSWRWEARTMSVFFQFAFVWDFLWFAMNPAYGIERFKAGKIWWFQRWVGPVPLDYLSGAAIALVLGFLSGEGWDRAMELGTQIPLALAVAWVAFSRRERAPRP